MGRSTFRFSWLRGADFAHGGVAAALTGAPHVPRGDGAVGTPAFAEGQEFLGRGHLLFAVSDGPALSDAEVVDGENVGSAQAEDQKHFDGPGADAADRDEALDEFFVGVLFGLFEGGDDPFDGFPGEIFHGEDFCAGEAGFAEDGFAELEHLFRGRGAAVVAEGFDAAENGSRGFPGNELVGDGLEEDFVGRIELVGMQLKWNRVGDELGQFGVDGGKVASGFREIERERHDGRRYQAGKGRSNEVELWRKAQKDNADMQRTQRGAEKS